VPGIIINKIKRLDRKIIRQLSKIPTTIISDELERSYVMCSEIKPILPSLKISGSAITVECMVGDNIMTHQAIYLAEEGDVIVINARGFTDTAVWGYIQTKACKMRKIAGVVIDGSIRDYLEISKEKFPVFCRGITSAGPHKGWGGNINTVIQCGGVPVKPGDVIIGDSDGVVVIPQERAKEVLKGAKERLKMEKIWLKKLSQGMTTLEIIGLDKKIKELKIKIKDEM
jgi:4-hydroxy-4-methyl-2-oxoglutarate aldolase